MKKYIILTVIILLYISYTIFQLSPAGGHHSEGMYDIVVGHLTDYPIHSVTINPTDNIIAKSLKQVNNYIAVELNGKLLKDKLFGIFDMRITKWVLMMWLGLLICFFIFIPLARAIKKESMGSKSRWINLWEALIGFVHDEVVEPNFDHKYIKTAMPYFLSTFFFILFCNLLGMVPGMATATGNLAVTGGLAIFTFIGMVVIGTIKQGPLWIVTGIVPHGIPLFLFPLMWIIELAGLLIKPFALMVRLFANMTAGHVVIIIFLYLSIMFQSYIVGIGSVTGSMMIYLLELLVAFIQAYIFTALSAMFIGASVHAH